MTSKQQIQIMYIGITGSNSIKIFHSISLKKKFSFIL